MTRHDVFAITDYVILAGMMSCLAGCGRSSVIEQPPYPRSSATITFDWSTHQRLAPGSDNWASTWAADGNHYTVWGDGGGFGGTNSKGRVSIGVARISGTPPNFATENIFGGYNAQTPAVFEGKSYGILEIDGRLLMWVSPGSSADNFKEQRLYTSIDLGQSWQPQDWSLDGAHGLLHPTFCQAGQSYGEAVDEYVYVYAIEIEDSSDLVIQTPGRVALMRVPRKAIIERSEYRFFAGLDGAGRPRWSEEIHDRVAVFEDKNGVGWNMSAVYHPELKRFLLLTEHGKSWDSRLGVFSAPHPWGPWETVFYGIFGEGEVERSAFHYNLPSGWLDGDRFVMVFTGGGGNDSWNAVSGRFAERVGGE